jgi:hypothetical protein
MWWKSSREGKFGDFFQKKQEYSDKILTFILVFSHFRNFLHWANDTPNHFAKPVII